LRAILWQTEDRNWSSHGKRLETTDGRYVRLADDSGDWWGTAGIDIVSEDVVYEYIDANPAVGIVVLERADENAAQQNVIQ
jgi:hypothetical protein